jgi:Spherulation-specific family 4
MTGNRQPSGPAPARRLARLALRPLVVVVIVMVAILGTAAGVTVHELSGSAAATPCQRLFVPAFFYPGTVWRQAASTTPPPTFMILDISGVGAGTAPEPHFKSVVSEVQAAGVTVLGYASTEYGERPAAEVEQDIRNYKAWYGVTGVFLDVVSGTAGQLPYYQGLARYIHSVNPGSAIWINPGVYPEQAYMSVADVVMSFEGTYAQYLTDDVPGWAYKYPPSRFVHTIHDTPQAQLGSAISLARSRNAGYVYITDGSGANPYGGLPSYWSAEDRAVTGGCPPGRGRLR